MKTVLLTMGFVVLAWAGTSAAYEIVDDVATGYGHAWYIECDAGRTEMVYYTTQTGQYAVDTGEAFDSLEDAAAAVCGE
jgi:hypothetical protein